MRVNLNLGTAYLTLDDQGKSIHTVPIDSCSLFFDSQKRPFGFKILIDQNATDWMDCWGKDGFPSFEDFISSLKTSPHLADRNGLFFLKNDVNTKCQTEVDTSVYVDFNQDFKVQGLEFLFKIF